jgi:hypothetical protein
MNSTAFPAFFGAHPTKLASRHLKIMMSSSAAVCPTAFPDLGISTSCRVSSRFPTGVIMG